MSLRGGELKALLCVQGRLKGGVCCRVGGLGAFKAVKGPGVKGDNQTSGELDYRGYGVGWGFGEYGVENPGSVLES